MNPENFYLKQIQSFEKKSLLRSLQNVQSSSGLKIELNGQSLWNFTSNNYLDLIDHPQIKEASILATQKWGNGSGGSRLLGGSLQIHADFEEFWARRSLKEAALLFNSGYAANYGILSALGGKNVVFYADFYAHGSMIDGILQSGSVYHRFKHNSLEHLELLLKKSDPDKIKWIVTEALFSMDGDFAPLTEICALAQKYNCLVLVDEAHSDGIYGPLGHGKVAELGLQNQVDLVVSTFGKAFGAMGAVVACKSVFKQLFLQKARSLIYSTALPPASVASMHASALLSETEHSRAHTLISLAQWFRTELQNLGFDLLNSQSQIVPLVLGSNTKALEVSAKLKKAGFWCPAIRTPTVPEGSARLRLNITSGMGEELLCNLIQILRNL